MTINRFCSSGVQAVALAADRIRLGEADVMIAAGTESMSMVPMMGNKIALNPAIFERDENVAIAYGMGITAEKVAQHWKVSREDAGRVRRWRATRRPRRRSPRGEFKDEITPYEIDRARARPRHAAARCTASAWPTPTKARARIPRWRRWRKLKPVFAAKGSVTAGNSSQMSDGAGAVVL